ncbi:MAG: hypothetical protein ACXV5Q_01515 [Frankiaceae bacterium]
MTSEARGSASSGGLERPLLFISHRHADQPIADSLRKFVTDRSGGRIIVFQSSSADADGARVGRELQKELKEHLWKAGVVVLIYTSPEEDWSYCMWECGVATHPQSPETKIVVFQCGPRAPSVYQDSVRIKVRDATEIQKFVNDFLTSRDFFPQYDEAIAPGFSPNGDEVREATRQLHEALSELVSADEGEDWGTVPFLRLQLTYAEVDQLRELDDVQGAVAVREAARVGDIDGEAKRLFGLGQIERQVPFAKLIEAWQQGRPGDPIRWVDDLVEQILVASNWRLPRFRWQLMESVDDSDSAKYAPIVTRVRSVPHQRFHEFDVYFSKFTTDEEGAIKIGFVDERQAGPG